MAVFFSIRDQVSFFERAISVLRAITPTVVLRCSPAGLLFYGASEDGRVAIQIKMETGKGFFRRFICSGTHTFLVQTSDLDWATGSLYEYHDELRGARVRRFHRDYMRFLVVPISDDHPIGDGVTYLDRSIPIDLVVQGNFLASIGFGLEGTTRFARTKLSIEVTDFGDRLTLSPNVDEDGYLYLDKDGGLIFTVENEQFGPMVATSRFDVRNNPMVHFNFLHAQMPDFIPELFTIFMRYRSAVLAACDMHAASLGRAVPRVELVATESGGTYILCSDEWSNSIEFYFL